MTRRWNSRLVDGTLVHQQIPFTCASVAVAANPARSGHHPMAGHEGATWLVAHAVPAARAARTARRTGQLTMVTTSPRYVAQRRPGLDHEVANSLLMDRDFIQRPTSPSK